MGKRQAILRKGFTFSIVSESFFYQEHGIEKVCSFQVSYTMLVPGKMYRYPKTGVYVLYGPSGMHRYFTIYFLTPCFRVPLVWDEYFPGNGYPKGLVPCAWYWKGSRLDARWLGYLSTGMMPGQRIYNGSVERSA